VREVVEQKKEKKKTENKKDTRKDEVGGIERGREAGEYY
jgi:hypothetical protein